MNASNGIINMLMSRLQSKNPQGFQMIQQAMNSGGNPQVMLQQLKSKAEPQQIQSILQQAKQMGCPENILAQIQNMK